MTKAHSRNHPGSLSRRELLTGAAAGLVGTIPCSLSARPISGLEILAAPTGASIALARLYDSGALNAAAPGSTFRLWHDPDDLRAAIVSGRTSLFSTPTHVPANLANRGMPIKLLCLLGMGHLYVVTSDPKITTFRDLAGKHILGFFKNDMPDLVFRACTKMEGLDADKDMQLEYVQTGMEAAQLLAAGKTSIAILSEPPATAAIMMAGQQGRKLFRAVSLQEVWSKYQGTFGIPMVGVAVRADMAKDAPELIGALRFGLPDAKAWAYAERAAAGELAGRLLETKPQVFVNSLDHLNMNVISARAAKSDLMTFYKTILDISPGALGGRMPSDDFYLDM